MKNTASIKKNRGNAREGEIYPLSYELYTHRDKYIYSQLTYN